MAAPAFSVMTPVYNGAEFISRCYAVLRDQTFTDWEWVVVDDGSTDGTAQRVREIADPRVKLISYPRNRGRGYARTEALQASTGDWVVLWDVDDIYFPDRLERINEIRHGEYDYYCSYTVVVDNDLNIKGVRGFLPKSNMLPRYFVHHTLACPLPLAREIGYDVLETEGGPGEDCRMVMTLAANFRGFYDHDALAVYQEDREVNLQKSIDTNRGQSRVLRAMYYDGVLPRKPWGYFMMMFRRHIKLLILQMMRIAPGLYRRTVRLRTLGDTLPGYSLPQQRRDYILSVRDGEVAVSEESPTVPSGHPSTRFVDAPLRKAA